MCIINYYICSKCYFGYPRFTQRCPVIHPPMLYCPNYTQFHFQIVQEERCFLQPTHGPPIHEGYTAYDTYTNGEQTSSWNDQFVARFTRDGAAQSTALTDVTGSCAATSSTHTSPGTDTRQVQPEIQNRGSHSPVVDNRHVHMEAQGTTNYHGNPYFYSDQYGYNHPSQHAIHRQSFYPYQHHIQQPYEAFGYEVAQGLMAAPSQTTVRVRSSTASKHTSISTQATQGKVDRTGETGKNDTNGETGMTNTNGKTNTDSITEQAQQNKWKKAFNPNAKTFTSENIQLWGKSHGNEAVEALQESSRLSYYKIKPGISRSVDGDIDSDGESHPRLGARCDIRPRHNSDTFPGDIPVINDSQDNETATTTQAESSHNAIEVFGDQNNTTCEDKTEAVVAADESGFEVEDSTVKPTTALRLWSDEVEEDSDAEVTQIKIESDNDEKSAFDKAAAGVKCESEEKVKLSDIPTFPGTEEVPVKKPVEASRPISGPKGEEKLSDSPLVSGPDKREGQGSKEESKTPVVKEKEKDVVINKDIEFPALGIASKPGDRNSEPPTTIKNDAFRYEAMKSKSESPSVSKPSETLDTLQILGPVKPSWSSIASGAKLPSVNPSYNANAAFKQPDTSTPSSTKSAPVAKAPQVQKPVKESWSTVASGAFKPAVCSPTLSEKTNKDAPKTHEATDASKDTNAENAKPTVVQDPNPQPSASSQAPSQASAWSRSPSLASASNTTASQTSASSRPPDFPAKSGQKDDTGSVISDDSMALSNASDIQQTNTQHEANVQVPKQRLWSQLIGGGSGSGSTAGKLRSGSAENEPKKDEQDWPSLGGLNK